MTHRFQIKKYSYKNPQNLFCSSQFGQRNKEVSNFNGNKVLKVLSLVLDASAKPSPGFVVGNNFWFGSRETCAYVNQKIPVELSDRYKSKTKSDLYYELSPFEVQWSVVYVKQESPLQGI